MGSASSLVTAASPDRSGRIPCGLRPPRVAADGVGIYGRTNDKVVTFFAFGLIAFFAIPVTVAP